MKLGESNYFWEKETNHRTMPAVSFKDSVKKETLARAWNIHNDGECTLDVFPELDLDPNGPLLLLRYCVFCTAIFVVSSDKFKSVDRLGDTLDGFQII